MDKTTKILLTTLTILVIYISILLSCITIRELSFSQIEKVIYGSVTNTSNLNLKVLQLDERMRLIERKLIKKHR